MKKMILILPILFILTACSTNPAEIQTQFKAEVVSHYNGEAIRAQIVAGNHMLDIEMKAPENLRGYTFSYKKSVLTISYGELKIDTEGNYLPDKAFVSIINNVLNSVSRGGANYSGRFGNSAQYTGKSESGEYIITSDYYTGYISKMELKDLKFSAEFKIR